MQAKLKMFKFFMLYSVTLFSDLSHIISSGDAGNILLSSLGTPLLYQLTVLSGSYA